MAPIRTSRPTMMSSTAMMVTPTGRRRGVCVTELLMIPPFVYDEHGLLPIDRTGGDHNRESLCQRKLLPFPFKRTTTGQESQRVPERFLPPFFDKRATNYSAISPSTNSCTLFLQPDAGIWAQGNLTFSIFKFMKAKRLFVIFVRCNSNLNTLGFICYVH
jgi:hypothetical protein